eukprot:5331001-Pyramimonas_sp.AAC.1
MRQAGDKTSAAAHRMAAEAIFQPKSVPEHLRVRLQKAHGRTRHLEGKVEKACSRYDAMEAALASQQQTVAQRRAEVIEAEAEHGSLAKRLAESLGR